MKTLKEYETTLEKQSTYIREIEEEKEGLHTQNEELLQKVTEMEHQLAKATTARDSLTTKIEELKKALEGMEQIYTIEPQIERKEHHVLDSLQDTQCHVVRPKLPFPMVSWKRTKQLIYTVP